MLEGEYGPCAFNYVEEEEDIESDEENENVSSFQPPISHKKGKEKKNLYFLCTCLGGGGFMISGALP